MNAKTIGWRVKWYPLDPQIWLILVALGHTGPGVLIATNWADDTAKMVAGGCF